ncbi:glycosyltransferase family 4 protein [Dissoconium aciculare CBS 342.82]|jgi:glycosyltransferase involved in cell wall biosynthesis|uniref:Glycosyltransferase family 4 protein n=1 Tax=Dissoconium aciculare CBS 342.82 TaxID=1314786 RepID=A0A6J3M474_9PEZI|nr:glycosyltransferase family 4 protein [Dissoconium aciculare CBS 342.82]KAF1822841.1 glycosyltransferase family 4 protein [Dissoconium aciculare CBS 342.82]
MADSVQTSVTQPIAATNEFPAELVGKKVLLATESLGPVNGVSRTTQSLVDYLRHNGVHVATCAPYYKGQHILANEPRPERQPFVNKDWVRSIEAKSSSLGSRAIGGAWAWHFDRDEQSKQSQPQSQSSQSQNPPLLNRSKSEDAKRKIEQARETRQNPEYRLQGYPLPYNPDLTVAFPFRLGRVYQETFKPDIIYLASPASVGFQFLVQLRQFGKPIPTLLNFQTDLAAYAAILFPRHVDQYAMWLLHIVQGYLFRASAVHTIFYPSAYVRDYMVSTGAPAEKMIQLGRGVDTELFQPSRRDDDYRKEIAPDGEIIFCCISRIAPEKGFEFLAQAAQKLKDTGLKFKLLIVGGNKNPAVMNEVQSYFKDLQENVIFTGMLRGTALARAYAAGDIFLHCSITETFGLVVLEAMASGVPVIARDEGGPSETVKHGRSGFLVAPHDLDTFVNYSRQLATNHELRAEMIAHARAQALDTTWDKINNQVALQLCKALHQQPLKSPAEKAREGYYGSWYAMARVYLAVGIVWVFWFIAVIPMMVLGFVHGMFK